ncbi:MAG: hypothetical protein EZS28_055668, partial [Streblomastix strix]
MLVQVQNMLEEIINIHYKFLLFYQQKILLLVKMVLLQLMLDQIILIMQIQVIVYRKKILELVQLVQLMYMLVRHINILLILIQLQQMCHQLMQLQQLMERAIIIVEMTMFIHNNQHMMEMLQQLNSLKQEDQQRKYYALMVIQLLQIISFLEHTTVVEVDGLDYVYFLQVLVLEVHSLNL